MDFAAQQMFNDAEYDIAAHDVLQAHHSKNRTPRAPDPKLLCKSKPRIIDSEDECCDDVDDNGRSDEDRGNGTDLDGSDNDVNAVRPRAPRNSKHDGDHEPKPNQLGYYSGTWIDVLENTKDKYRFDLHLKAKDPFPLRTQPALQRSHQLLLDAMMEHKEDPSAMPLNESKSSFYS
jgi:hypothetical protein